MKTFSQRVYELTTQIPKGKVSTYGAIARAMGTRAYRSVGQALHVNPYAPHVPCHRVVNSKGELHGFASGLQKKKQLLESEGIVVKHGKVDLEKYEYVFKS